MCDHSHIFFFVTCFHSDFHLIAHHTAPCANVSRRKKREKLLLTIRAVMLEEHEDLVAGEFNGAAWRRQTDNGNLSSDLPMPGSTPLWGPGAVTSTWSDVCGVLEHQNPTNTGKYGSKVPSPFTTMLWITRCGYTSTQLRKVRRPYATRLP